MNLALPLEKQSLTGIDRLVALVGADMARVNAMILSRTGSDVAMIPEVAKHLINSGGKRLRPMLTLVAAQMFGYRGEGHIKLAAAVEFMHTATLLHDDVVDESDLRRGKATARKVWGNQASVLVGDFLLGQAFKMMVEVGSLDALDILSSAATVIAEGEVLQLAAAKSMTTTEDKYLTVIGAKTAALFSAAAEVGPTIAGLPHMRTPLAQFGTDLGLAFQLVDDALDYSGHEAMLGKRIGDDFREGKVTLPVILAFARGTPGERAFWQRAIEGGDVGEGDLEIAADLIRRYLAIEETIARARSYASSARAALASCPVGEHRLALEEVIDFTVERAF